MLYARVRDGGTGGRRKTVRERRVVRGEGGGRSREGGGRRREGGGRW